MAEQKKGFIYRMVVGKDRDEDYARSTLPTNRWQLFWDIMKGRLGKLCIINLLMLIFFLPVAALLFFRSASVMTVNGSLEFLGSLGVGYPGGLSAGVQQISQVNALNNTFFMLLIPASLIAAVGLAGGFYIMRNIVWTEGTFVANDFWRGIKLNIVHFLLICLILSGVIYVSVLNFNIMRIVEYTGDMSFWTISAQVATYIMLGLIGLMALYMMSLTVTYKLKFWHLIKNSFILTIGLLFQNLFFIAMGLAPFLIGQLLMLFIPGQFIMSLVLMVYILIGFSIFVLVWTNYNQWAYDKFINDRVEGAVKNRGIYPVIKDGETVEKRKREQIAKFSNPKKKRAVKPVTDKDVQLTDLTSGFTRANIQRLEQEKEQLKVDAESYAKEHEKVAEDFEADNDEGGDEAFVGYEDAMLLEGYDPATMGEDGEIEGDEGKDE